MRKKTKDIYKKIIILLSISYCVNIWACNDSFDEFFTNQTDKDLLLSVYMHANTDSIKNDFSELLPSGETREFKSCAGEGTNLSYDFGISVGPYNFITNRGNKIDWNDGLGKNYSKYMLMTKNWNGINWTIYSPGGKNHNTVTPDITWKKRDDCTSFFKTYDICYAVDLENAEFPNIYKRYNTFAHFYIGGYPSSLKPINKPWGKF